MMGYFNKKYRIDYSAYSRTIIRDIVEKCDCREIYVEQAIDFFENNSKNSAKRNIKAKRKRNNKKSWFE